jgi:type I restriction enzyme R subunit
MSLHAYTEDQLVEQPAIGLFSSLGWQTVSAIDETFGPSLPAPRPEGEGRASLGRETKAEVVLVDRLRAALSRLNSGLPAEAIQSASLEKALAIYGVGRGGTNPVKDKSHLVEALREAVGAATAYCAKHGVDLAAMDALPLGSMEYLSAVDHAINALIGPDAVRRDFFGHEKLVGTLYRAVKPDAAAIEFSLRISGIATLAAAIRAKRSPNPPDITTILAEITGVLDESITGTTIREGGPPAIDLSRINSEALAQRFRESTHKNTNLEALKAAIAAKLEKLIRLNRTRADFAEKFEALIESYNAGSRNIEQLFQELLNLSKSLDEEQERHIRENLSKEELVIFDILTRPAPELTKAERDEVKKVAKDLLARFKQLLVLNWRKRTAA